MRVSLGCMVLAACGTGGDSSLTSDTLFASVSMASGEGAQHRYRAEFAHPQGMPLDHDGAELTLLFRAVDSMGISTEGDFVVGLTVSTALETVANSWNPGNHELSISLFEEGTCEPGCFDEINLTWAHEEGIPAQVDYELRATIDGVASDLPPLMSLTRVF